MVFSISDTKLFERFTIYYHMIYKGKEKTWFSFEMIIWFGRILFLLHQILSEHCGSNGLKQGSDCQSYIECYDGFLLEENRCPRWVTLTPYYYDLCSFCKQHRNLTNFFSQLIFSFLLKNRIRYTFYFVNRDFIVQVPLILSKIEVKISFS